jgi:hypothetical protein
VAGTALVIYAGTTHDVASSRNNERAALRPLVFLGDISYSLYLWHWPLVVFAAGFWPRGELFPRVLAAAFSLLPAWLSHRFVERRFRAVGTPKPRAAALLAACCIGAPMIAMVAALPIRSAIDGSTEVEAFERGRALHLDETTGCSSPVPLGDRPPDACHWGDPGSPTSLVLLGDSNAGQFSEAFIQAAESGGIDLRIATMSACPFIDALVVDAERQNAACRRFVLRTIEHLAADPPDVVAVASATDFYLTSDRFDLVDAEGNRGPREQVFAAGLMRSLERLRATGARVALINVIPKPGEWTPAACSSLAVRIDTERCVFQAFDVEAAGGRSVARRVEDQVAEMAEAEVWNFDSALCPSGRCIPLRADGTLVWRDSQHITVATARELAPAIGSLISDATQKR